MNKNGRKYAANKKYHERHRETILVKMRDYREKNREIIRAGDRLRYAAKRAERLEKLKEYPPKEKYGRVEIRRRYRAKHRDQLLAKEKRLRATPGWQAYQKEYRMRRNANCLKATPRWANRFFMREIYALAALRTKMLGIPFHIDHVVPLKSKIVCGLHCEQNMAILPALSNIKKGNRTWPDMP